MRLIPGKTKVRVELFKGVSLADMFIALVMFGAVIFVLTSNLPGKIYIIIGLVIIAVALLARLDTEPNYLYILHILRHYGYKRNYERLLSDEELVKKNSVDEKEFALDIITGEDDGEESSDLAVLENDFRGKEKIVPLGDDVNASSEDEKKPAEKSAPAAKKKSSGAENMADIIAFTGIKDDFIEYGGKYFGAAVEISPVEFRFFSEYRRENSIEASFGKIIRSLPPDYSANIVKIERPILYDEYLVNEEKKIDELRHTYENGAISEEELQIRIEVLYNRIEELKNYCYEQKVVQPFYYVVFFDSNKSQLETSVKNAIDSFTQGEIKSRRLDSKELAVFLKYSYQLDFDEREIEKIAPEDYAAWAMPDNLVITPRTVKINQLITHNMRIVSYPAQVGDAWLAGVMSVPGTKVVVKTRPMDHAKSVRAIDRSLQELRGQYMSTGIDSKRIELNAHIETLSSLLSLLQGGNETLLETNVYVTAYDLVLTQAWIKGFGEDSSLAKITGMKRVVRRVYQESNLRLNNMEFEQMEAFIGSQISAWDPMHKDGRGIPSNSLAAMYPWIYSHVCDENGIKLGTSDGVPVLIDFFRRDSERVNSNMVIVGKSGSGKSYATKSILSNLAADNSKMFILDPENEYSELAHNLHGKFINVGNAQFGRLNPFHIITSLGDDEADDGKTGGSYATHLQFLEEFFHQILPDCDKDAMEYLNSIVDRMYTNMGITDETNLSELSPEDYPTFDDLYDAILSEFQSTDNDYIRTMLRTLMNYVSKFSTGGRNANIWNGPSTITTDENFTVFNFQSLLANRNGAIANAQMLLVLKYIDNEIIKNRDYNLKYGLNRKVVVVIDEAHVFIDAKYPVALDFMFQLAKRIRKYNGMQIVITQNIKDFVGSEEIARKSTAIINACQYSFIFALSPNDMDDLCKLYEKAGGINAREQEQIISAGRGQAFTVMSPQSRSSFKIEVPPSTVKMFRSGDYISKYFSGGAGAEKWEEFIGESRSKRVVRREEVRKHAEKALPEPKKHVMFIELDDEGFANEVSERLHPAAKRRAGDYMHIENEFPEIPDIPETPEEFEMLLGEEKKVEEKQAEVAFTPEPAAPEIPVLPVAQPVASAVSPSSTELLLTELLGKFSHEAMVDEIRRSVRAELEKEMAARPVQEASYIAPQPEPAAYEADAPAFAADDGDDDGESGGASAILGSIFDFAAEESGSSESSESEEAGKSSYDSSDYDYDGEDNEDDGEDSSFDLLKMIMQQAESMSEVSPIEMMEDYGDTELEVTLEELIQYNNNMKKKNS